MRPASHEHRIEDGSGQGSGAGLGHIADELRDILAAHALYLFSVQEDASLGLENAVDAFDECGFTGTIGPHQAQDLGIGYGDVEIIEDLVAIITECETLDADLYQIKSS